MESFKIEVDAKDLKEKFNAILSKVIEDSLTKEKESIQESIKTYFHKSFFNDKITQFDRALDWQIESVFREGVGKAMEELNFKELIAEKAKEMLSNSDLIKDLAEEKVRSSLGLPKKD